MGKMSDSKIDEPAFFHSNAEMALNKSILFLDSWSFDQDSIFRIFAKLWQINFLLVQIYSSRDSSITYFYCYSTLISGTLEKGI